MFILDDVDFSRFLQIYNIFQFLKMKSYNTNIKTTLYKDIDPVASCTVLN